MKKTMLTYKTLDRFENEYITEGYSDKEIKQIEFAAYVANMNACGHPEWKEDDIFTDFLRVIGIDKITVTPKEKELVPMPGVERLAELKAKYSK